MSNWVGGGAVTKIGNTGRGTDGTGGREQTRGLIWGLWNFVCLRDGQAVTKWAFGFGDSQAWVC